MTIDQTLLSPKEIIIEGQKFLLSKLPATVAREVLMAFMGAIGDDGIIDEAKIPIEKSMRLLSYASIESGGQWVRFGSKDQIDAFIPNLLVYMKLERAMYNHSMDFSATAKN